MAMAALAVAGAGYQAYAQNQAGKQQKKLADKNAELIDAQAEDALQRGEEQARAVRRATKKAVGSQRTAYATQGVDVSTGTAMDIQDETKLLGLSDEATVRKNAFREAWGLKKQASNQRLGGKYARREGRNAAIASGISGLGASYRAYYDYDRPMLEGIARDRAAKEQAERDKAAEEQADEDQDSSG